MPRNVLFAAKRGKVDFKACPEHLPAVGAETLEDGVVRRDVPADLLGRFGVELGIEGERYVDDAAARGADDMRMRLDRAIEAAAARRLDGEDLAGVGQEIEIAVDRTAADFVILRAHGVVDFVGGGMVIALAHGVKNQLSLPGIPSLHRHAPRLFDAKVHVFVSERHPLARRSQLSLADLTPYTRYSFEQGTSNSFYYAEEPFSYIPCNRNIRVSDRGTLTNLLITSNGYALSTGVLSSEMQWGMASIPLADAPTMHVGYIMHDDRKPSPLLQQYLDELNRIIHANQLSEDGVEIVDC